MLTVRFKVDGVLTDADGVSFGDSSGEIGLREVDGSTNIVEAGVEFTHVSTGLYQFDESTLGLDSETEYEYYVDTLYEGEHTYEQRFINSEGEELGSITLRFCVVQDGAIVEPETAPVLCNPTALYGVVSQSDNSVVVAANAAMTNAGGLYSKTVPITEVDQKFRYYVKVLGEYVVGVTDLVTSSMLAVGRYTNSWRVALMYGGDNMHQWLSLPGNKTEEPIDYALRAWSFVNEAESFIDAGLGRSYFDGDGLDGDFADGVPQLIQSLSTMLAGVIMYESMGITQYDTTNNQVQHRLRWQRKYVEDMLKKLRNGAIRVDAGIVQNNYPTAHVSETVCPIRDGEFFSLLGS